MTKGERLTYVDTAKFLAIWMVIVSHSCMDSDVTRFFFAFHVPLFFFLYGFVYHPKEERVSLADYLKTKIPSLFGRILVPYLLLAFILGKALSVKTLPFVMWGTLQSLNGVSSTHLWFLPCYFVSVLLFGLLFETLPRTRFARICRGGSILFFAATSAFLNANNLIACHIGNYNIYLTGLGISTCNELYIGFPLALNVAFTGVAFIYAGYLVRLLFDCLVNKRWIEISIALMAAIGGTLLFLLNHGSEELIAMSYAKYGNYFLFLSAAILLSIATLVLSKYLDNRLFSILGKYTLAIYGFHLTLTFFGNGIVKLIHITNGNLKAIIIGSITLIISCAAIPVIRYIDPNILGERTK